MDIQLQKLILKTRNQFVFGQIQSNLSGLNPNILHLFFRVNLRYSDAEVDFKIIQNALCQIERYHIYGKQILLSNSANTSSLVLKQ